MRTSSATVSPAVNSFSRLLLSRTSTSNASQSDKKSSDKKTTDDQTEKKEGWLSNFFVRRIETGTESHSSVLSDKDTVFVLEFHKVKPEFMENYLAETSKFVKMMDRMKTGAVLVGSWTVDIGDQDEAVHIWKYAGGYPHLNKATATYRTDPEFVEFRKNRAKMLRSRKNQILLQFTYWGGLKVRPGKNLYELRSYTLKPGTMIEWGNYWAKGIQFRQAENEATAGFFSHIGDLYIAHHLWSYESLQTRQQVRDQVWDKPGWDICVQNTVPLIRHMTSRILIPTPFSPLQ